MTHATSDRLYEPVVIGALCRLMWPLAGPVISAACPPGPTPAGRRRAPVAPVFAVVVDVVLNRVPWHGSSDVSRSTAQRRFSEWSASGVWQALRDACAADSPVGRVVGVVCRLAEMRALGETETEADLVSEAEALAGLSSALRQAWEVMRDHGVTQADLDAYATWG